MISFILRSWSILLQTVAGASCSVFLFILLTNSAQALIDINLNGVSDLWEKTYNSGNLFTNFDRLADPDGDGWTNGHEAISGTDPNNPNTLTGILRPQILQSPAVYINGPNGDPEIFTPAAVSITWPTLAGKQYTLFASVDLTAGSWLAVDNDTPRIGTTAPMGNAFPISQPDGSSSPLMFYRLAINDADSDGDTLTNHEEATLTKDPFSPDTDLDGFPDNTDPAPLSSATLTDPDGAGLVNTQNIPLSIANGLLGRWNLEDHQIISNPPTGYTPFQYPDSAGANPATSFSVFPHLEGMVSKATNHAGGYLSIPTAVLGTRKIYTTAFWALLEPGSISAANGAPVALFSHHQRIPWLINNVPQWGRYTEQLNGLWFEKSGSQERLRAGTHIYTNHLNGVPTAGTTTSLGINILRDAGTADDGKWHHYTFVHHDATKTLYIDGVLVGTATHTPATISINSIYSGISLGRISGPSPAATGYFQGTSPTRGRMDRLRIWNRPLTPAEATALYREDIDKDDLWDITENNRLWRDNNSDGLQTTTERAFSSSPFTWQAATSDTDDDGLTDVQEQTQGTKIDDPDTDGDLLPDGWEVSYQLNPLIPNDPNDDTDQDALTLLNEYRYNTNPTVANTDGDSQNDSIEVNQGSNPNDNSDSGAPVPPDQQLSILLGIGDESGSHSEDYVLNCYRLDPTTGQETRIYTLRSGGYGLYKEETQTIFKKGETYTFQIDWQSSNLEYQSAAPGVSAEGPDYDYTFKVQPQGSNTGLLIDAYDPRTRTVGNSILAVAASNVATTEAEFKQNYESKRVAVVNPKLEWVAMDGYDNIDNHIDPWSKPISGKRIFPDFKDPLATQLRHAVQLVVSGVPPGLPVYVKAFDVDDSTAETFDFNENGTAPVIDIHGKAGDDNLPDYLNTSKNGHFWTGFAWGTNTSNKVADANGQAKFIFRVGMQPGNNYRAVGSVNSETMYSGVQTDSPTTAKYLGPESNQIGGAPASPLLTVWRKLWIENDSMEEIGTYPGSSDKKNDLTSDMASPTIQAVFAAADITTFNISSISDRTSFTVLQNSTLKFPQTGASFSPLNTIPNIAFNVDAIQLTGNHSNIQTGATFRLYDDDGFGLSNSPLPRNDLVDDRIKGVYRPAFIEVMNANPWNDHKTVDFYRSHAPVLEPLLIGGLLGSHSYGVLDDALDAKLEGNENLWCASVMVAYQPGGGDSDPNDEEFGVIAGVTIGDSPEIAGVTLGFLGKARVSIVYSEVVRDLIDDVLRSGGSTAQEYEQRLRLTVAHEIGHQPLYGIGEAAQHAEDGLMQDGGHMDLGAEDTQFKAKSIKRFRQIREWRQKE